MRTNLGIALAGLVALTAANSIRADDEKQARATIDKAIKAAGGADKLAKYPGMIWKEKGKYYGMGDGVPYTGTYTMQGPDKTRMEIEGVFLIIVNGDKGWTQMGGETKAMSKEQLAEEKETRFAGWVSTLAPLNDKGFTLKPLGESKVEGEAAVGVKVSHKGHRDVQLYFSKKTGLLVKSEHTAKAMEQEGKDVKQEAFYSDYQDVSGTKRPMKVVIKRDGKPYVEAEHSDLKLVEKVDDKQFEKP
jgi:outer membrane lipoprotein-sorting protein